MAHDVLIDHVVAKYGPRSVEELIQDKTTRDSFQAERKTKFLSMSGAQGHLHQDAEKVLHLPGGKTVVIRTDASGHTTHVEDDECQHAIVRPGTYRPSARMR